ncbi:hypothetical protein FO519_002082 [Halicephalobus sp. NKZ332]|nr:hypothetical protein FO519_002082 [Halicephalobus sp. NKZ332]
MPNIGRVRNLEEGEIVDEEGGSKKDVCQSVSKDLKTTQKKEAASVLTSRIQKKDIKTPKKGSPSNSAPVTNSRILSTTKHKPVNSITAPHKIDMLAGLLDDKPPTRIEIPNITRKRVLIKPEKKVKSNSHPLDDIGYQLDLLANYVDNW